MMHALRQPGGDIPERPQLSPSLVKTWQAAHNSPFFVQFLRSSLTTPQRPSSQTPAYPWVFPLSLLRPISPRVCSKVKSHVTINSFLVSESSGGSQPLWCLRRGSLTGLAKPSFHWFFLPVPSADGGAMPGHYLFGPQ